MTSTDVYRELVVSHYYLGRREDAEILVSARKSVTGLTVLI